MQKDEERVHMEEDEQILLVVRKHWFILLRDSIAPLLLFIVPVSLYFVAEPIVFANPIFAHLQHKNEVVFFFISLWALLTWMMLFFIWTDYYLDMWTITDRRIIAIDQQGFFKRNIASFRYERLQDINIEINGFIATMLDFGDIHAQTAGHDVDFRIAGVSNPRRVKALILEAVDALLTGTPKRIDHTQEPVIEASDI